MPAIACPDSSSTVCAAVRTSEAVMGVKTYAGAFADLDRLRWQGVSAFQSRPVRAPRNRVVRLTARVIGSRSNRRSVHMSRSSSECAYSGLITFVRTLSRRASALSSPGSGVSVTSQLSTIGFRRMS